MRWEQSNIQADTDIMKVCRCRPFEYEWVAVYLERIVFE